jgi:hypothetical protein
MLDPDHLGHILTGGFFLAAGAVCLGATAWLVIRDHRRARTWQVADGTVVDYAKARPGPDDDGVYFKKVVEFRNTDGKVVRVRSTWRFSRRGELGKAVRVFYPPGQPQRARIVGENLKAYAYVGLLGLGAVVVAVALIVSL